MQSIRRTFYKYVSTNVIGMIGISCYILADTFFVSKALGALGLAALNFSISIYSLLNGFGLMIGIGGATEFSIHRYEDKSTATCTAFTHALRLGGVLAVVFLATAVFGSESLARALGANGPTLDLTVTYLRTILSFSPFFLLNNILLAFVRNDHSPRLSMAAMLISSLSNIILDYIFMFPMGMGMFGAAFATGLSPVISLGILSLHFIGKKQGFHICPCKTQLNQVQRITSLGFSAFITELASAISLITFNLLILGIAGNIGVAAYGIIANVALIATAVFVGISQGLQPLASRYYGNRDMDSLRLVLRYSLETTAILSVVVVLVTYLLAQPIVSIFNSGQDGTLATLAEKGVHLYFPGYLFAGLSIVSTAFLSSATKTKEAMMVSLLRSCLLLVPIAFMFSRLFDMNGIWFSFPFTEALVAVLVGYFLWKLIGSSKLSKKQKKRERTV